MSKIEEQSAAIFKFSFDVPINRSSEEVWPLLFTSIDAWWMPDYRALGADSKMSFDPELGSAITERGKNGEALEWYRTQMIAPGKSIYLVGYLAPDWGGPTTSMLKLSLSDTDSGCLLAVSDALHGSVTESGASGAERGWREIFETSFKKFAEASV